MSWFTEQVRNGTIKTGVEYIKAVSNAYHQSDGFTANGDMVKIYTPKYKEVDPQYYEKYQSALEELREYESTPVEDLIKYVKGRRKAFEFSANDQILDLYKQSERYKKIIEEIEKWNPPTEMFEKTKQAALSELRDECEFNKKVSRDVEDALDALPDETADYYTDEIFKKLGELKDKAVKAFESWQEHLIEVKKHNLYVQQLDESLKEKTDGLD